jgi:CRISPR-associated protein Cmr2
MSNEYIWKTKVAARLHDPAEKALVLLRDPQGHENGTSRALKRLLGFEYIGNESVDADNDDALAKTIFRNGIPIEMYRHVQRADWWAAAADRPQWPLQEVTLATRQGQEKTLKVADWAQVHWTKKPVLVHPLTGDQFDLGKHGGLSDTEIGDIKQRSFDHSADLLAAVQAGSSSQQDWHRILLALWRFGPELREDEDNGKLGALWNLLPADTRVPDHSIWDHLDLASAFAGAFAADPEGEAALLSLAIGPVQTFIAAARKIEDLWAGSHLLARLSWEAMKAVCERLGPDAILFPRLRGIPQVDLWLRDDCGLPLELFKNCDWNGGSTDSNPLFSAALPNRFVALVPRSEAVNIAAAVEQHVRAWLGRLGQEVVILLLHEAGYENVEDISAPYEQMQEQLAGFPEVHWAAVPFSLIRPRNAQKQTDLDTVELSRAMAPFFGVGPDQATGFLATPAWQVLQQELALLDDQGRKSVFYAPNPGVLYPAVHELAERVLAAAKMARTFAQTKQQGWRCSLTGEAEWLTTDRRQLQHSYRQQTDTLWARLARRKPAWAKKGEHLGALSAIKRLWPTLFLEEVNKALGDQADSEIRRFVVSTHTMALAHQLEQSIGRELSTELQASLRDQERVALPRKLARQLRRRTVGQANLFARIPGWLDAARDSEDEQKLQEASRLLKEQFGAKPETYYGLVLLDGDRMGAWLSGGADHAISYRDSFHPQVQTGFDRHADTQPQIKRYGQQLRALSPNRHLAISGALNDFSLRVVRHVVEEEFLGRLIYAGGDDLFAMLPVVDLLPCMTRLRHAYSGHDPEHEGGRHHGLTLCNGFALLDGRLMRMMGRKATASCGAVIAHHQAPLAAVRRELAAAEKRAKHYRRPDADGSEIDRNAFSLTIIKRSGGALHVTDSWGEPLALLTVLRNFLAQEGVSRRAVYNTLEWLVEKQLPVPTGDTAMLQTLLTYQLKRQTSSKKAEQGVADLARRLTVLTLSWPEPERIKKLRNFLSVAEFLARETRNGGEA